ncbi:nitrogen permease regulator 3 [Scheffersomyces amazonensis]|uniref:nitrogen permease regulator 3 n=1 Tax=Scheffersomyces amazonensis TaxID=1078765 RepID=UPI00315CC90D
MSFNLPNPSLVGILLIISTHSGPQLIYQYPENLSKDDKNTNTTNDIDNSSDEELADYDDSVVVDAEGDESEYTHGNTHGSLPALHHQQLPQQQQSDNSAIYFNDPNADNLGSEYKSGNYLYYQWDADNLNFHMHNTKDILTFLDELEQKRDEKFKKSQTPTKAAVNPKVRAQQALTKTESNVPSIPSTANTSLAAGGNTNSIFGIEPSYICEMLAPPKSMCNTRFEVMIDNKLFLGLPIHRYDNGKWRMKESHPKKHRNKKDKDKDIDNDQNENDTNGDQDMPKSKLNMNMFHLVFIMNPPIIEHNYRIDEMFHFVISKLTLVLRYEQSKSEFISSEIRSILNIKEQYKDMSSETLSSQLLSKSSLCRMIHDCYDAISQSKIANLSINNKLRSFQIPIKTEFHSLPESSVPFIPGSHLSSTVNLLGNTGLISIGETTRYGSQYNSFNNQANPSSQQQSQSQPQQEEDDETDASEDVIYFALILLDDPESIIRDIKTEPQSPLANFIRMINPTESLIKLSLRNSNSLDILQIKSFAFHLIYWRRARVIQPLSTRAAYIVSPMAPITINLFEDIAKFKKLFPTLPALPQFLQLLSPQSKKPTQFAAIIPSKDHRDIYLEALGWLVRYGYVTQLQTFIWLKISRKIKIKVDEDLENESSDKKRSSISSLKATKSGNGNGNVISGTDNTSKTNTNPDNSKSDPSKGITNDITKTTDTSSKEIDIIKERLQSSYLGGPKVILEDEDDTIILDPGRATTLERRWINKIVHDECQLSPELIKIFYKLVKYMNGKSPLELLLLKENISRAELRKLLFAIEDHIISVRHW